MTDASTVACIIRLFFVYYLIEVLMNFDIELEQEEDGRWIAEIPEIPGVLAYGITPLQAGAKAKALALRVLAERMENEASIPGTNSIEFANHYELMAIN
jgi:predicted RNase H-like HicB family nuclease